MKTYVPGARGVFLCSLLMAQFAFGGATAIGEVQEEKKTSSVIIPCDNPAINLSPYVGKFLKTAATPQIEATMPGAYIKTIVQGTATIGVVIDGTANNGHPLSSMPFVEFSVDDGEFKAIQLCRTGQVYTLPLVEGLNAKLPHRLDFYFRASNLGEKRWRSSASHLRINGLALDAGGSLASPPLRLKRAIAYGDSITEGVGADGLFTSWTLIGVNNARATWFPIACAALSCEYGQLGSGGWGMSKRTLEMPPLPDIWDLYDPTSSRLTGGLLEPEPDYIFCCMGTNDPELDITPDYIRWLVAMRKACPKAQFFCIVPPLGVHLAEVHTAVKTRNQAGDQMVHVIDTAPLKQAFRAGQGATSLAYDGVHPSVYGNAMLGAFIAVEAQKVIGRKN